MILTFLKHYFIQKKMIGWKDKIIYTGPIDKFYDFKFGSLEYRSLKFETEILECENYQGNAVVNYTDAETKYTRIIEPKHFNSNKLSKKL